MVSATSSSLADSLSSVTTRRTTSRPHALSDATEMTENSSKAAEKVRILKTIVWEELEEWRKDNEYILSGYRRVQNSWIGCLKSVLGYAHNETVNIHSHLWGAIVFFYFLLTHHSDYVSAFDAATWLDSVTPSIFLCAAVFCLLASATFHMVDCHSHNIKTRCHALDYSGIIVLIVGSFFPSIYYGFFCDPHLQLLYLTIITVAGALAAVVVLNPTYSQPSHRGARTKVFVALGLCAVIPVTHAIWKYGLTTLNNQMGFGWLLLSGALYLVGATIYATRVPERLYPGRFDYFFSSHQIFHIHVVLAALAHYKGVLTAQEYRHIVKIGMC